MRVAIVCPYAWDRAGGVQSHVRSLAVALQDRGHDALVLAPRSVGHRGDAPKGVAFTGRAAPVPANGSVAPLTFGPGAAARLRSELKRFEPDVLHLHEPLIPSTSLQALMVSNVPAVGTFHAAAESSFGYKIAGPVLERAAARVSVRTAVSDAARAFAQRYFPGEYVLTPNGIDTRRFADAKHVDIGGGPTVLFFSRLERRKGAEILIQAMSRLRHMEVSLVIAGDGPERSKLESLARSLKLDVNFLGRISEDRVPSLYAGATVYCAPATHGESFGIVLLEAMATGTPIVASDLDGFRSVAGNAAELVPPGDSGALARSLSEVLSDEAKRDEMSTMGRRLASMYDWHRLAGNVEMAYERAIQRVASTSRGISRR
jgi:phosphatidyl-myo-inositol alpha-mannosyltransferase